MDKQYELLSKYNRILNELEEKLTKTTYELQLYETMLKQLNEQFMLSHDILNKK
jgi:hypothetical protein